MGGVGVAIEPLKSMDVFDPVLKQMRNQGEDIEWWKPCSNAPEAKRDFALLFDGI